MTVAAMQTREEAEAAQSRLDGLYARCLVWLPYAALALGSVLSLALTDGTARWHLTNLAISLAAAVWVYLAFTRIRPLDDAPPLRLGVYFLVMLALAGLLMARDTLYFVVVITGFFHAGLLRPFPAVFAGVGATSVVINSQFFTLQIDPETLTIVSTIVVVQTIAISGGFLLGERTEQISNRLREALREKEEALEENAGLHMQLLAQAREAGVLDERQRMAREIHDTVAQGLAGIITQLHAADGAEDGASRRRHVDSAVELARDSLAEARRTVQAIGPPTLEKAQLPEALAEETAKWSESGGVPVEFTATGEARPMHPEIEVTLLRTAQEALANVGKHAAADRVGLTLSYMDDQVALDVRDDGVGFDPAGVKPNGSGGYGLAAMRQRVARLAGSVSIESSPGGGTVVSVSLPAIPRAVADAR